MTITPQIWKQDNIYNKLLTPLTWLWIAGSCVRAKFQKQQVIDTKIICVGNPVMGGSGKTPLALYIGQYLESRTEVSFLSKGYLGELQGPVLVDLSKHTSIDVGDEALLLADSLPTIVSKSRAAGAAMIKTPYTIMDDGLQNFSVPKHCSIVVIDGGYFFGNRKIFPAGPLREKPEKAINRSDAIVIIGDEGDAKFDEDRKMLAKSSKEIFHASVIASGYEDLKDKKLYAFAGIARPEKFFNTLEKLGLEVIVKRSFADHHKYSKKEIDDILNEAENNGLTVVTTQKDYVKIKDERIRVLQISLSFADNSFDLFLEKVTTK